MIPGPLFALVPFVLGLLTGQPGMVSQSVTRLVVDEEVVLRVPLAPTPPPLQLDWQERGAPSCIPARAIRGAILSGSGQVDFLLAGHHGRVRADLDEDCPALDFYGGLYLEPNDGRLCAGRDAIHSRIGGSCTITHFHHLVPKLRR